MPAERWSTPDSAEVLAALRAVGVPKGGTVYVAASLAGLALLPDPVGVVLDALDAAVGAQGTIVMPTFHSGFRFDGVFDRERTPSRSGVLSEAFRLRPGAGRTWAPPYNPVAVRGRDGERICAIRSPTAFGVGSVFDHLVEVNAVVLVLGCSFHDGVAHVHWLEERHEVPYRTWQEFTGRVVLDGVATEHTWPCHVRRPGVELDAGPLGELLADSGAVREMDVGLTRMSAFVLQDFVKVVDPWFANHPTVMVVG